MKRLRDIEDIQREKKKCRDKGDVNGEALLCNDLGDKYIAAELYVEAIGQFKHSLQLMESCNDRLGVATVHRRLSECFQEQGDFDQATEHVKMYSQISLENNFCEEMQRSEMVFGNLYFKKATSETTTDGSETKLHIAKAEEHYERSLKLCEGLKERVGEEYWSMKANALVNLGNVFDVKNDMKSSANYYMLAADICQKIGLLETDFLCKANLADLYKRDGDTDKCLWYFDQAYRVASQLKQIEKLVTIQSLRAVVSKLMMIWSHRPVVHLGLEDYRMCRKFLHRALRLRPSRDLRETVTEKLKLAVRIEQCAAELRRENLDGNEKMKLLEKIGDFASNLGANELALKMYQSMLACALEREARDEELVLIYVSLAQTCADLKLYRQAIEYYEKEISHRTDKTQIADTFVSIAAYKHKLGEGREEWQATMETALRYADEAGNKKLQRIIVTDLLNAAHNRCDDSANDDVTRSWQAKLESLGDADDDIDDDNSSGEHTQSADLSDIDIAVLSCSDSEPTDGETLGSDTTPCTTSRSSSVASKRVWNKVNEKGETPLHQACISGKVAIVRTLLERGHPVNKPDNAGWTPLHEAANHCFPPIVQMLVDKGAKVNHPGDAKGDGTTPLHDVCAVACAKCEMKNPSTHVQRSLDVIEILLKHGANVNAKDKDGYTPLDNLRDQHTRNVEDMTRDEVLAVRRMEHSMQNIMKGGDVASVLDQRANVAESDLPEMTPLRPRRRAPQSRRSSANPTRSVTPMPTDVDADADTLGSLRLSETDDDLAALRRHPERAPLVYEQIMQSTRRSAKTSKQLPKASNQPRIAGSALVTADEYVGDDWLDDDLPPAKRKRRNKEASYFTSGTHKRSETAGGEHARKPSKSPHKKNRSRKRPVNGHDVTENGNMSSNEADAESQCSTDAKLDSAVFTHGDGDEADADIAADFEILNNVVTTQPMTSTQRVSDWATRATNGKHSRQVRMTEFAVRNGDVVANGVTHSRSSSSAAASLANGHTAAARAVETIAAGDIAAAPPPPPTTPAMRLRVRIKDDVIAVPVKDTSVNMAWLAEEAARRYHQRHSLKPLLSLRTSDGADSATYSNDDLICDFLTNNDVVQGVVERWHMTPLPERYESACDKLQLEVFSNVKNLLSDADTTNIVQLKRLALTSAHLQPVTQALEHQHDLRELHLQENLLRDTGIEHLLRHVAGSCRVLTVLNVSCNKLTLKAVESMARCCQDDRLKPFQSLQRLDLSFNALGDTSTQALSRLIGRLPALQSLSLRHCGLTQWFFQTSRLDLADAFNKSSLRELDVSFNKLGCLGVEQLLRCLRADVITSLNLTATIATHVANTLTRHLHVYLTQSTCVLQTLIIDSCCIQPDQLEDLCSALKVNMSLMSLSLSCNPKLTSCDVMELLLAATANPRSQLSNVVCKGAPLDGRLATDFIDSVNDKLQHASSLRTLVLSGVAKDKTNVDSLAEVWSTKWGQLADVEVTGHILSLRVKDAYSY